MQLTKYGHSCVRLDDGDRALVLDPGMFSDVAAALDGADTVLITHEHPDHLVADALLAAAKRDPRLMIYAPAVVADTLAELGEQVRAVGAGETFDTAGFRVATHGGQHALIHPLIPTIANVGYLIDSAIYHPGDSFIIPTEPVTTLLLPVHAPWMKVAEAIDFAVAVGAPRAYAIHDGLVNERYFQILGGGLVPLIGRYGTEFDRLTESVDV